MIIIRNISENSLYIYNIKQKIIYNEMSKKNKEMVFETDNSRRAVNEFNELNDSFGSLIKGMDRDVLQVIEGLTIHEIEHNNIIKDLKLLKLRRNKEFASLEAQGFKNIADNFQLDDNEIKDIKTIKEFIKEYLFGAGTHRNTRGNIQYITVKNGKSIINDAGFNHIERSKIRLTGDEITLYEKWKEDLEFYSKMGLYDGVVKTLYPKGIIYTVNHYTHEWIFSMDGFKQWTTKYLKNNS